MKASIETMNQDEKNPRLELNPKCTRECEVKRFKGWGERRSDVGNGDNEGKKSQAANAKNQKFGLLPPPSPFPNHFRSFTTGLRGVCAIKY
jgi:hypothetical protein